MTELRVDFNRPVIVGREMEYMSEAIANAHISGDGPFTKKCHALLQEALGVPKALLTTSCTHALEMAAILLNIQDVFNSRKRRSFTETDFFTSDSEFQWRVRSVRLSFVYRFNQAKQRNGRGRGGADYEEEGEFGGSR